MNSIEEIFLQPYCDKWGAVAVFVTAETGLHCIASIGELRTAQLSPIWNHKECIGFVQAKEAPELEELKKHLAPLFPISGDKKWQVALSKQMKVLQWVAQAQAIAPDIAHWIGIYWKESFLAKKKRSKDLLLGAYIGESTEHIRIPMDRGFCGLALSEERVMNVDDVTKDDRHIACSLLTRSELVIPLKDKKGKFIAELDIDSHKLSAFSPDLQKRFEAHADTFSAVL